jgi:hypothetical protein
MKKLAAFGVLVLLFGVPHLGHSAGTTKPPTQAGQPAPIAPGAPMCSSSNQPAVPPSSSSNRTATPLSSSSNQPAASASAALTAQSPSLATTSAPQPSLLTVRTTSAPASAFSSAPISSAPAASGGEHLRGFRRIPRYWLASFDPQPPGANARSDGLGLLREFPGARSPGNNNVRPDLPGARFREQSTGRSGDWLGRGGARQETFGVSRQEQSGWSDTVGERLGRQSERMFESKNPRRFSGESMGRGSERIESSLSSERRFLKWANEEPALDAIRSAVGRGQSIEKLGGWFDPLTERLKPPR